MLRIKALRQFLINLALILIVSLPFLYYSFLGVPPKNGFYCNDETIGHPYRTSTVPSNTALILGMSVPLIAVTATEALVLPLLRKNGQRNVGRPEWLTMTMGYIFGAAASHSLVTIAKFTVGRLRPHFFDVCRPKFEALDCGTDTHPKFITDYECKGNLDYFQAGMDHAIHEAHVSFVSGHSSFMFQAATFLALYLQARVSNVNFRMGILLVPTVQLAAFALAFWVALTRVKDHMHHPGDVIAGALIGTFVQVFNVVAFMRLFSKKPSEEEEDEKSEDKKSHYTPLLASSP